MAGIINCAHRGASSRAPENTVAALMLAARLGASMVEIDIQQTADDELVLFHDDELGRTSSGSDPLWKHTLEQLKQLDAGAWFSGAFEGEKIPTLEEAVDAVRGKLGLNIELKIHGHERRLEELVASRLQELNCLQWCVITSFDRGAVDRLGELVPGLKAGYIVGRGGWDDGLLDSWVTVLSLEKTLATEKRVGEIHEAGKDVFVWTVNEVQDIRRLSRIGVDGLISNYPGRVSWVFGGG